MLTNFEELKAKRKSRAVPQHLCEFNETQPLLHPTPSSVEEPTTNINIAQQQKQHWFKHLNAIDQSYGEHFINAMTYSWCSLKASVCFFCHAIWPDVFEWAGSNAIYSLNDTLREKFKMLQGEE